MEGAVRALEGVLVLAAVFAYVRRLLAYPDRALRRSWIARGVIAFLVGQAISCFLLAGVIAGETMPTWELLLGIAWKWLTVVAFRIFVLAVLLGSETVHARLPIDVKNKLTALVALNVLCVLVLEASILDAQWTLIGLDQLLFIVLQTITFAWIFRAARKTLMDLNIAAVSAGTPSAKTTSLICLFSGLEKAIHRYILYVFVAIVFNVLAASSTDDLVQSSPQLRTAFHFASLQFVVFNLLVAYALRPAVLGPAVQVTSPVDELAEVDIALAALNPDKDNESDPPPRASGSEVEYALLDV